MPLIRIDLQAGKPADYRQAIFDSLHRAMQDAFDVEDGNQFMTITEHEPANFRYASGYGVTRTDEVVYIQMTVFSTRTAQQKKALFARIAARLAERPGIRPENVFVTLLDAPGENWSVGNGIAQFA